MLASQSARAHQQSCEAAVMCALFGCSGAPRACCGGRVRGAPPIYCRCTHIHGYAIFDGCITYTHMQCMAWIACLPRALANHVVAQHGKGAYEGAYAGRLDI